MVVICWVLFSFWCFWFTGMHRIILMKGKKHFSATEIFFWAPLIRHSGSFSFFFKIMSV